MGVHALAEPAADTDVAAMSDTARPIRTANMRRTGCLLDASCRSSGRARPTVLAKTTAGSSFAPTRYLSRYWPARYSPRDAYPDPQGHRTGTRWLRVLAVTALAQLRD